MKFSDIKIPAGLAPVPRTVTLTPSSRITQIGPVINTLTALDRDIARTREITSVDTVGGDIVIHAQAIGNPRVTAVITLRAADREQADSYRQLHYYEQALDWYDSLTRLGKEQA